ncbi:lytic transglycosylase domain-containing protein [Sphaerisporangium sp. TRM90804]|uniref:lytic transglycosylase domain-containing protein n=1 Tax=Sphaerisporangium sp. TRM90804 TaxID=3031113 RepID=UPI00244CE19F|nr:lytic transglycosylase domain-containing protein [Sphaerisporangium sp. TRM90804]MDH2424302.1 lytic transglycosylase domain-containing protein [Sphaerisporangium sp. TRM90804]
MVGLALLIVLGVATGGAFLLTRGPGDTRPEAAGTPLADARALTAPVSGFPALTPPASPDQASPSSPSPGPARPSGVYATAGTGPVAEPPKAASTPPRLIAVGRGTVGEEVLGKIAKLRNVGRVAVADGGAVRFSTATLNLLAVDPAEFRSWAPKAVADEPRVWEALARGEFVADSRTAALYRLQLGGEYQAQGSSRLRVAASAPFGLPGVDGVVGRETGRALGLVPGVAVLVHAAKAAAPAVATGVKRLLGAGAQVVTIGAGRAKAPVSVPAADPEDTRPAGRGAYHVGRPGSYLDLYRVAAGVCPGLSWSVLAAIGQVESGHGRNNGPSSAGALGPMQFMPATWKAYGVDGDGDGKADIWSAYDAVPSAARYLCANGGGQGGQRLRSAVYRYNHSWAYVNKVLGLATAYARGYP